MTDDVHDDSRDRQTPEAPVPAENPRPPRPGLFGLWRSLKETGREVAAAAREKIAESVSFPEEPEEDCEIIEQPKTPPDWKVKVMHAAAEKLRGAADGYITAKLDEIEARVDAKLDHVEERIDSKIVELHRQLRRMRDRELRHRLRLLRITLTFTVLVAILSLVYKWLGHYVFD